MVRHLKEDKLINESQHAFMGKRSCLANLLKYLEYITTQIDVGNPVDVIYFWTFKKSSIKYLVLG